MPRNARTELTSTIAASEVHSGDTIVGKDGNHLHVDRAWSKNGTATIRIDHNGRDWTVPADREVTVLTEHECDCNGTGHFRFGGVVENGVYKGGQGEHFACHGKGYQTRQDVIRCITYWNKYARISA
jgi:hypothetical protein